MRALGRAEILDSFINLDDQSEVTLPWWVDIAGFDDLDYLGWVDPARPERAYMVTEFGADAVGAVLRLPKGYPTPARRSMCSLCLTPQSSANAVLMAAPKAGVAGRNFNTVGCYICADLACSLYVRSLRRSTGGGYLPETLEVERRIARLQLNLVAFFDRIAATGSRR